MNRQVKYITIALVFVLMLSLPADVFANGIVTANRVIINDYYVIGGGLVAGETSKAVFILKNMGNNTSVNSVLITGWIESGAPVEFAFTNQAYISSILPRSETSVEFEYYTKNVDLKTTENISVGFTIAYVDEGSGIERSNSTSLRLPISEDKNTVFSEEYMQWPEPNVSALDELLSSSGMRLIYITGFIISCIGIFILLGHDLAKTLRKR